MSDVQELYRRGVSMWCLGGRGLGPQKELLNLYAGQTVAVVTLRGTEGDDTGLIRQLMNGSTPKPASLGRFPFLEVFLVTIPPRNEGQR